MLDNKGFRRPTYDELINDMEIDARSKFGQDVNTSPRSVLGILLRIFAWFLSKVWNDTEDVYNSAYVNTAEGVQLDRLGPYVGIQRNLATWATGSIQIIGTAGFTVLSGFKVLTETEILYETVEDIILDSSGKGEGEIRAINPGTGGNVAANSITIPLNPDENIINITNPTATSGGLNKETDPEFRQRFAMSTAGGGAATIDAIRSALLRIPGVRAATVIENDTMNVDDDGRPPKSFEAFLLGGDPDVIGGTLLSTKAAGIETWGKESVVINDLSGSPHTIRFSLAEKVNIHIRAIIRTNDNYPADGDKQLVNAFVMYIGGADSDDQVYIGLNMGEEVVISRIIAGAYRVPGMVDVTVEVSTDGVTWQQGNVSIAPNQVAQTSYEIIRVVQS